MFTQLTTHLPVIVTSKDNAKGMAIACIDYGIEHNLIWVTVIDATGEIWCVPNHEIRVQNNWTINRGRK